MKRPEISIIVPVYNMEMYLRECLDSIKAQTFSDWECILVDDGSKDSSPGICDEYGGEDSRFKVIHKKNGGLSSARNAALRVIQGKYVGFVDADDWIEPGMYELLHDIITENDADMSMCGYIKEYRGRHSAKHLVRHRMVIDGEEAMREIGFDRLPNYVWNKLHKREIITCDFPDGRNFEDIFVYGQWLKNVRKMVIDPTPEYHYRMRAGSIIHVNPAKNRYDYFLSCIDRMSMIESLGMEDQDEINRNKYINKSGVTAAKLIARQESNKMMRLGAIKRLSEKLNEYPLPSITKMNPKLWWRSYLLRRHPNCFSAMMRAVHVLDLDSKHKQKQYYR